LSVTKRHTPGTVRSAARSSGRVFALLALLAVVWGLTTKAGAKAGPVWVRLELVENTADGSAFDRCEIEGTVKARDARSWRIFYGEAQAGAAAGWEPIRPQSGCGVVASDRAANPWRLRGSPYLLVDVTLEPAATSENEVRLQTSMTIRRLTAFGTDGKPSYEQHTESRTLRVPPGSSAVIPILVASPQETEAFGIRELLLRFRVAGSRPRVEYGEVAVTADVPRSMIFLDGGLVGRTSTDGPFELSAVRTGKREIVVVDPSGREARALARVEKGTRTNVSLTLLPPLPLLPLLPKPAASGPGRLRPLGRNPQGGEEFWREKDSALLVRIPGGEFRMGSAEGEGEANEHPQHAVHVQNFLMDKTEVTWGQYKRFLAASSQPPPKSPVWGMPEALPVSSITWGEAGAFCAWAGGRLPTEAEWERAARGDDARQYPWGNTFDPWRCNTRDGGPHAPTPAADYPDCVSPYGVLDLSGSVAEWCSDWYEDAYYAKSPAENPKGPETGKTRVSRGGAWMSPSQYTRVVSRAGIEPTWHGPMQGFRCAQDDRKADEK
jgi:formylglycine-generating enzyme required for sulfatase activity